MSDSSFAQTLRATLCDAFDVRWDEAGFWAIRSPLHFGDGDALPVFLSDDGGTWKLTDLGMTVSHLFFDEFQFTEARFGRVAQLVDLQSARLAEHHAIEMDLNGPPTAMAIGSFMQLVSQVQGIALTSHIDRDQNRYVTLLRSGVEERLLTADFESGWSPPELGETTRANYKADLRIATASSQSLLLFAASTSDKANVSALTMSRFRSVRTDLLPLLAYHPEKVAGEAIYRFQDEVQDDAAVLPVLPGSYDRLVQSLLSRGVAVGVDG